jgi:hypothetical protein
MVDGNYYPYPARCVFIHSNDVFPPPDAHTATFVPSLNAICILSDMSAPETNKDIATNDSTPLFLL